MTDDISTLDFVAFDTETTGLQPYSEELVEVAAVRFNLESGAKEYFQTLVNPRKPIPPQAMAVHGITDEMVASAPTIDKVLPSFFQFLGESIPVAHNAPFDIGFLSLHSLRHGIQPPSTPVLDSCMFSRRVLLEQPSHRLQSLVESLGIAESTFHRALADTKSCMEVFRTVVKRGCGFSASWEQLLLRHGKTYSFLEGTRPLERSKEQERLDPLFTALEGKFPVWILYEGGFSAREVTPLLLYAKGAQRYMEATCHLDGLRKSFRLDRIKQVFPVGCKRPVEQDLKGIR